MKQINSLEELIETIQSGKYYVSYQLANVPYNSNTIYYKLNKYYNKIN